MRYEDFVLQLDAGAQGDFRARVLRSPFGEGGASFRLPFPASEASASLAPQGLAFASAGPVLVRGASELHAAAPSLPPLEVGAGLYRSVFRGPVRTLLDKSRGQLQLEPDLCLRLKIKLDPNDAATAELADLPWELLFDDEVEDHFALLRQTTLIRYLDVPRPSPPIPFTPPLRILAVGASPSNLPALDLDEECARLEELERREPGVEVRFLRNASTGAVRETLAEGGFHVLHFMGHGDFDGISGEGILFFEQPDGGAERVTGRAFAARLKDLRSLGVVTLNACNTARALHAAGQNPFRGVATALVLGGIPAVVAMQHPIPDDAAIGFSSAFYRQLARGVPIDTALTEGRQAILSVDPEGCEWAIPVLFLRVADGNVFVARPATAQPTPPAALAPAPTPVQAEPLRVEVTAPPVAANREPITPIPSIAKPGWPLPKVAGAAGGVLVLAVGIYAGMQGLGSKPGEVPSTASLQSSDNALTQDTPPGGQIGANGTAAPSAGLGKPKPEPKKEPVNPAESVSSPPGGTTPVDPPPGSSSSQEPVPTVSADPSALKATFLSLGRREEGGLQVTVAFRNAGDLPLSLILDEESTVLSGGGQRYGPLGSDLPSASSGYRLSLAAGASAQHTLDFPTPKLGSTQFVLSLWTSDGKRIRVEAETKTLSESQ